MDENFTLERYTLNKLLWKSVYRNYLIDSSKEELQQYVESWENRPFISQLLHVFNPFAHHQARAEAAKELLEERAKVKN